MKKILALATISVLSAASFAQNFTFYNFIFSSSPLLTVLQINGVAPVPSTSANFLTFQTPSAAVGDALPARSGSFNLQYDAVINAGTLPIIANEIRVSILGGLAGTGRIAFREDIFEIDALGNEIGSLGGDQKVWFAGASGFSTINWTNTVTFPREVTRFRAKKSFDLYAPDSVAIDLAAVTTVNQAPQVVPEPMTMAALGLGLAGIAARRRKKA